VLIADAGARALKALCPILYRQYPQPEDPGGLQSRINDILAWCADEAHLRLDMIEPVAVATYVERLVRVVYRSQLSSNTWRRSG
jgi:hypothetical protein